MSTPPPATTEPKPTLLVGRSGLQLRTLDEVWRFALCVAKSGLAPKGIEAPEAITVAIQMGLEVGLPPLSALQNIAVINGRPSLWGDAQLAVVRGTGELEVFEEWYEEGGQRLTRNPVKYADDTTAVCRVKRAGYEEQESSYSVADAKRAGLWAKTGPWSQVPFRMLRQRARSFILRDNFGDALRGLLSAEEVGDIAPPRAVAGRVIDPPVPFLAPAQASEPASPPASVDNPPHVDPHQAVPHAATAGGAETPPAPAPTPRRRAAAKALAPPVPVPENETPLARLRRRIADHNLDQTKIDQWTLEQVGVKFDSLTEEDGQQILNHFELFKAATN